MGRIDATWSAASATWRAILRAASLPASVVPIGPVRPPEAGLSSLADAMEARPVEKIVCTNCSGLLGICETVCPHCGTSIQSPRAAARTARKNTAMGSLREVVDNRWAMVFLLFCVMGCLGVPLLLISRGFSVPAKVLLSIAATAFTAALVWLAWFALRMAWTEMAPLWSS